MTTSLKALAAALLLGTLVAPVLAQDAGPRGGKRPGAGQGMRPGGMMRMQRGNQEVLAKLSLTAAQKAKVAALDAKTKAKVQAQMAKGGAPDGRREGFRDIVQAHRKELNAILTPVQRERMKTLMKERRERMMKERGAAPGGRRGPGGG